MTEITLKLKAPTKEMTVKVKDTDTIKELRDEAAKAFEVTPPRVCLIYAGKILKDENSLSEHKLQDGLTVHVVIKQEPQAQQSSGRGAAGATGNSSTPQSALHSRPVGTGFDPLASSAARFLNSGDMSPSGFASMQQAMQQQVMRDPELLRNVMESPLVQSLMSNPEIMRTIVQANPQMREIMDRNPELAQLLTNPEVLRQSMEIASNPSLVQEMMRNYDRAVLNLESIPGGSSHLQRIYESVQEPMLNAMQGGDANNPFADLASGGTTATRQTAPTNEPMPNPWAAPPASSGNTATSGAASTTAASTGGGSGGGGGGAGSTMLPGGFSFNAEAMANALQQPYVRSMMDAMTANPETLETFLRASPLLSGASNTNPAVRDSISRALPALSRQISQSAFRSMLTNPRAMRAFSQIQEGVRILEQEAPEFFAALVAPSALGATSLAASLGAGTTTTTGSETGTTTTATTPTTTTTGESNGTTTTGATASGGAGAAGSLGNLELASLLASLLNVAPGAPGGGASDAAESLPPEQRYASQLQTLASMGFTNEAANLQALIFCRGDVNAAIDRLLGQQ